MLCVDFWNELLTILSPPEKGSPVYQLLVRLVDASLPHLCYPEVVDGAVCDPQDYARLNQEDISEFRHNRHEVGVGMGACGEA